MPPAILAELKQARERSDPIELAEALSLAHHCLLGPQHAKRRLGLADELIAVSPSTGRAVDGLMGLAWRTVDLFLAGDRRAVRSLGELREHLVTDRCDGLSYLVAALDVMLAMREGRLAEAEELADRCYALGVDVGDADALGWYGAQLVAIRWLQGRGEDVLPLLADLVTSPTVAEPCSGFVAAVAALAAATGDHPTARARTRLVARRRARRGAAVEHLVGDDARRLRRGPRPRGRGGGRGGLRAASSRTPTCRSWPASRWRASARRTGRSGLPR